jgi:uncharacterized Tic20 family protein
MNSEPLKFTEEQSTTIRFQIAFAVFSIVVSLVLFWAASTYASVDLRYGFLFLAVMLALVYLKEGLIIFADVFIVITKMLHRNNKM